MFGIEKNVIDELSRLVECWSIMLLLFIAPAMRRNWRPCYCVLKGLVLYSYKVSFIFDDNRFLRTKNTEKVALVLATLILETMGIMKH